MKQQHTVQRVFERLRDEHGFARGYTVEKNHVRFRRAHGRETFVPLSPTGAELLFEVFSQRYERGSTIVTTNVPFEDWTWMLGSERLTGALLDRLAHHVSILTMKGDSDRLRQSTGRRSAARAEQNQATEIVDPEISEITAA